MAGAVLAADAAATEAGTQEDAVSDGTGEETEAADAPGEGPDAPLLAFGLLPPPPPAPLVLPGGAGQEGRAATVQPGSGSGAEVRSGQVHGPAGQGLPGTGSAQQPTGAVPPTPGAVPAPTGQDAVARLGSSVSGKADPAVLVRDPAAPADVAADPAALALAEGLSPVRESFDALVAGFSAAPAGPSASGPSAPTAQAPPAAAPASPPVPVGAVPMTIGLRSLQGSSHFEIRLDPGELGRIDVSLDIDKERGTVMAHLVVDRIETLALLQRDAGSLQQALSQAGLDASDASINLSLRSDTQSGGQGADGQGAEGRRPDGRPGGPGLRDQPEGRPARDAVPLRTLRGLAGLDIRI